MNRKLSLNRHLNWVVRTFCIEYHLNPSASNHFVNTTVGNSSANENESNDYRAPFFYRPYNGNSNTQCQCKRNAEEMVSYFSHFAQMPAEHFPGNLICWLILRYSESDLEFGALLQTRKHKNSRSKRARRFPVAGYGNGIRFVCRHDEQFSFETKENIACNWHLISIARACDTHIVFMRHIYSAGCLEWIVLVGAWNVCRIFNHAHASTASHLINSPGNTKKKKINRFVGAGYLW